MALLQKDKVFFTVLLFLIVAACHKKLTPEKTSNNKHIEFGLASYYADKFIGKPTASGELYDANKLTAAHKTLAFGTKVEVTNLLNGKRITVVVNDRGPFVKGRIIDLSKSAAKALGMIEAGIIKIQLTY